MNIVPRGVGLRKSIRQRGTGYVLAGPAIRQRMRTGSAAKGARDYHWAMIEITPDDTPEGHYDHGIAKVV